MKRIGLAFIAAAVIVVSFVAADGLLPDAHIRCLQEDKARDVYQARLVMLPPPPSNHRRPKFHSAYESESETYVVGDYAVGRKIFRLSDGELAEIEIPAPGFLDQWPKAWLDASGGCLLLSYSYESGYRLHRLADDSSAAVELKLPAEVKGRGLLLHTVGDRQFLFLTGGEQDSLLYAIEGSELKQLCDTDGKPVGAKGSWKLELDVRGRLLLTSMWNQYLIERNTSTLLPAPKCVEPLATYDRWFLKEGAIVRTDKAAVWFENGDDQRLTTFDGNEVDGVNFGFEYPRFFMQGEDLYMHGSASVSSLYYLSGLSKWELVGKPDGGEFALDSVQVGESVVWGYEKATKKIVPWHLKGGKLTRFNTGESELDCAYQNIQRFEDAWIASIRSGGDHPEMAIVSGDGVKTYKGPPKWGYTPGVGRVASFNNERFALFGEAKLTLVQLQKDGTAIRVTDSEGRHITASGVQLLKASGDLYVMATYDFESELLRIERVGED